MEDGKVVDSQSNRIDERRPEILELFETHVYDKVPEQSKDLHFRVLS